MHFAKKIIVNICDKCFGFKTLKAYLYFLGSIVLNEAVL